MSTKDVASLTVAELKKRAKAAGIRGYSKLKKAELVRLLGAGTRKVTQAKPAVTPAVASLPSSPAPRVDAPVEAVEEVPPTAFDQHYELPGSYLKPRAVLLAKNPEWLFCYWDFDGETASRLTAGGQTPLLRVLQNGAEVLRTAIDLEGRRYYIQAPAGGGTIQVQIGRDALGEFLPILSTGTIETPRARVSEDTTVQFVAPEWTGATPEQLRGSQFLTEAQYQSLFGHVAVDVPWYRLTAN